MTVEPDDAARLERLADAVRKLDQPTREIFLLHRVDRMPYPQIARRLGITLAEVEHRIAGAMLALDRAMRP